MQGVREGDEEAENLGSAGNSMSLQRRNAIIFYWPRLTTGVASYCGN